MTAGRDRLDEQQRVSRPSAREVADLLGEYRRMLADAGGVASRVPVAERDAWVARKHDLLARIHATTEMGRGDERDAGQDAARGWTP